MPHLSSSDSSLVSLDWAAEEGTEQVHQPTFNTFQRACFLLDVEGPYQRNTF